MAATTGSSLTQSLTDGDLSTVSTLALDWLKTHGPGFAAKAVAALALFVVGLIVARVIAGTVGRALRRAKVDAMLASFLAKMLRYALLALVLVVALGVLGIPVTGFAALLAAAGFAVGMALSGTLGHFAAGVMLLIFRPFKVGDVVNLAGYTAKVHEIELFQTHLNTFDNRRIIIPNTQVFDGTIENLTHHATRRVDVKVGVSYDADLDATRAALEDAVAATAGTLAEPPPVIYLDGLGGSSVDYTVRVWAATADYWPVRERLTAEVKRALDAADINIPYPQMDVHLARVDALAA